MSTAQIRRANTNDKDNVVALLEGFYPGIPDHWGKLFAPRAWQVTDEFPGFVLEKDSKIVGFLGLIFSEHEIPNKGCMRFCNLTCWYIDPNYRQYSLPLFLAALKLPNVTWTNLTSTPKVFEWLKKIGFESFQETQTIFLPLPTIHSKKIKITIDVNENQLERSSREIFRQHQNLCCKHILIEEGDSQCYGLVVLTRYKKLPLAKIYYLSHPDLFKKIIKKIRTRLCWKLKVAYLLVEGDMLQDKKILGAWKKKLSPPRLFKSKDMSALDMSLLNSELFVLGI